MRIQSHGGLRSYSIENRDVNSITLFGDGKVYARIERGWLEAQEFKADGTPDNFSRDVTWIEVGTLSQARKENLSRTDSFYIPTRKGTVRTSEPSRYDLYIHVKPPKDVSEHLVIENSVNKSYATFATFEIPCGVRHYTGTDEATGRHQYEIVDSNQLDIAIARRNETTTHGDRVMALMDDFQEKNIPIGVHALEKLLQHYNLTPKK